MSETIDINAAVASMAQLFQGKAIAEQKALLAALERAGAAVYRSMAEQEANPTARAQLIAAAEREEQNAEVLDTQR
jgi:hypothetical protein